MRRNWVNAPEINLAYFSCVAPAWNRLQATAKISGPSGRPMLLAPARQGVLIKALSFQLHRLAAELTLVCDDPSNAKAAVAWTATRPGWKFM